MPAPVGRPAETVSPEVSECSRMPDSRRPVARATSPCAPSWAMVTTCRVGRHRTGDEDEHGGDGGGGQQPVTGSGGAGTLTRSQKVPSASTGRSSPADL